MTLSPADPHSLPGQTFGSWTLAKIVPGAKAALCVCRCGMARQIGLSALVDGSSTGCGSCSPSGSQRSGPPARTHASLKPSSSARAIGIGADHERRRPRHHCDDHRRRTGRCLVRSRGARPHAQVEALPVKQRQTAPAADLEKLGAGLQMSATPQLRPPARDGLRPYSKKSPRHPSSLRERAEILPATRFGRATSRLASLKSRLSRRRSKPPKGLTSAPCYRTSLHLRSQDDAEAHLAAHLTLVSLLRLFERVTSLRPWLAMAEGLLSAFLRPLGSGAKRFISPLGAETWLPLCCEISSMPETLRAFRAIGRRDPDAEPLAEIGRSNNFSPATFLSLAV